MNKILVINPGSTSTKVAVYEDKNLLVEQKLHHACEDLDQYQKIIDH